MVKTSADALLSAAQRHPRLLQDRGRQARPGARSPSTCATASATRSTRWPCGPHSKGLELACHVLPDVPDAPGRRPGPAAPGRGQPGRQRHQVHRARARSSCGSRSSRGPTTTVLLHFAVRDTGIGIPPDKQDLIFEAFAQADTLHHPRSTAAPAWAWPSPPSWSRMMGGRIWVESEVGPGQHVPLHRPPSACSPSRRRPRRPPAPIDLEDLPVLVVDDNATNRRILQEMLTNWRMKPTVVDERPARRCEALTDAARADQPFALVLLDAMMPEMDGFERGRARSPQRPELTGSTRDDAVLGRPPGWRGPLRGAGRRRLPDRSRSASPTCSTRIMTALGASVAHRRAGRPTSWTSPACARCASCWPRTTR